MATEKRLIDAKDFDLRVSRKTMSEVFPNWKELPEEVQDAVCKHAQHLHMLLETQHTVDAVEVIRCKDCKCYDPGYIRPYSGWCSTWETAVRESGYCHHGERRTK